MKKKIKLAFSDFWGGFNYNPNISNQGDNSLYQLLSERFDIEISENPDFLIFSVFGYNHYYYRNCKKIFYTGENVRPDYNFCDYSVTFDYIEGDRNFRFPLSAMSLYEMNIRDKFIKNVDLEKIKSEKLKFCNFIFSNPNADYRNELLFKLSKYKRVDSGGRAYNNLGYLVDDKLGFLNNYKFTIAFENSEYPGYTTEKLVHPKIVNSIPIYWGNPSVGMDWNTNSFIDAYKFSNIDELVEYIIEVDNNDDMYYKMLSESHFINDDLPFNFNHNNLLNFFEKIFT